MAIWWKIIWALLPVVLKVSRPYINDICDLVAEVSSKTDLTGKEKYELVFNKVREMLPENISNSTINTVIEFAESYLGASK